MAKKEIPYELIAQAVLFLLQRLQEQYVGTKGAPDFDRHIKALRAHETADDEK